MKLPVPLPIKYWICLFIIRNIQKLSVQDVQKMLLYAKGEELTIPKH